MLTDRQRMILNVIIDDYIRSAEPIGSRSISKRSDVSFSPATIRNEMADLEELGFLEQPHTSAGRIPSIKGYRYYVDHLVKLGEVNEQEKQLVRSYFTEKMNQMEQIIQHAAMILSNMTNYTSIVLGPETFTTSLKHFQLVPLSQDTAVAIIVTNTGHVENRTISLPEDMTMEEMQQAVNILNAKLVGVPLVRLKSKLHSEVGQELGRYADQFERLLGILDQTLESEGDHRVFMSGTTNMLTQPEFKDVDKVKTLLDLLEETPTIMQMFNALPSGIQVRIGTENTHEAINTCSLITATYSVEGKSLGTIGILGPTRMDYGKVIGLLDILSKDMAVLLGRWYK
ncbi:heat-inducible transcriptional repressor HrcA [Paenibacillus sacheonensis]|uniref:Heat-inducible transcription repressor HrcA n=1 Tax=Paenibacillus sacheonensis TaxID=742054 RepID=A0A7X4YN89_9BACL|nr:heat-inducible transcriptional repressor HrcA [Paenibacillus sacheonensis]MBM7565620.1 heat-inducible transcriptional repressor [Paenibacillus sacheonensis]NBC69462.1 heat-inducible transcriptional repressor HrcA [Paenibacillus sacheonensis]